MGALSAVAFYTLVVVPLSAPRSSVPSIAVVTSANAPHALSPLDPSDAGDVADAGEEDAGPVEHQFRVADLKDDPSIEVVTAEVGHRAMSTALASSGLSHAEAGRIIKAFASVRSLGVSQPKDSFSIARAKPGGHVVAFEYQSS
ncbi:MAG: hypothetical protein ACREJX_08055, partial [Polyangiaceae bacterium]